MEPITIDGMDEHAFRHSIEDMLRGGEVDAAIEKLRALLQPYAEDGRVLPRRFLDVSSSNIEFAGWHKLRDRLYDHGRRGHPISAIGVVLADSRALGGPGPSRGWLSPFIKTFYFSDEAYPFSDATRDDLLDGYSREGFGWQGDYQATDATLSIKGIDDLYGAVVELEDRLLVSRDPSEDEVRAGSIGACYLAALIHQALRETIRKKGLPRPLCVLAACDGVYPFFDAPVAGLDECTVEEPDETAADETSRTKPRPCPARRWSRRKTKRVGRAAASLLTVVARPGTKRPVIVLAEEDARQASEYTEMASARRMVVEDESVLKGLLQGLPAADLADFDEPGEFADGEGPWVVAGAPALAPAFDRDWSSEPQSALVGDIYDFPDNPEVIPDMPVPLAAGEQAGAALPANVDAAAWPEPEPAPFAPPPRHSLRSRINLDVPQAKTAQPLEALLAWFRRVILRQ